MNTLSPNFFGICFVIGRDEDASELSSYLLP